MDHKQTGTSAELPSHTCPWWLGVLILAPIRRLVENPDKLVLPLVRPGDRVLELGPALGYFSLPLAEAVGPSGKLICVEVQESMLNTLRKRLAKRGLLERTQLRLCAHDDLGLKELEGTCDLAVAIHVVHETLAPETTVSALARCLKPGGQLLLIEPPGHCSAETFAAERAGAEKEGLVQVEHPLPKANKRRLLRLWRMP